MKRAILIAPLLIGAVALAVWAEDTRKRVELPPPMQAHMLANMRNLKMIYPYFHDGAARGRAQFRLQSYLRIIPN